MVVFEWKVRVVLELQDMLFVKQFYDQDNDVFGRTIPKLVDILLGLLPGGLVKHSSLRNFLYELRDLGVLEETGVVSGRGGEQVIYSLDKSRSEDWLILELENSAFFLILERLYFVRRRKGRVEDIFD